MREKEINLFWLTFMRRKICVDDRRTWRTKCRYVTTVARSIDKVDHLIENVRLDRFRRRVKWFWHQKSFFMVCRVWTTSWSLPINIGPMPSFLTTSRTNKSY
jgi:hypothetical protein